MSEWMVSSRGGDVLSTQGEEVVSIPGSVRQV